MTARESRPATIPREKPLPHPPDHLRGFLAAVSRELPNGFVLTAKSIARKDPGGSRLRPVPLCSPFRVIALAQDRSSGAWSRIVELVNPAGDIVECSIPSGKLDGRPRDAIAMLSDHGLLVRDHFAIDTILNLIRAWPSTRVDSLSTGSAGLRIWTPSS